MADKKISALTGATTPLAGTEVLPIVQGSATVKVSVANLTAGRAVAMAGGSFTDNIVQGTAAKGVNFTANTPAAGMTSQLLNRYEEGTWTPTFINLTTVSGTPAFAGTYTRIGRTVYVTIYISPGFTTSTANSTYCNNLPITASGNHVCVASDAGSVGNFGTGLIQGARVFTPTWVNQQTVIITGTYTV